MKISRLIGGAIGTCTYIIINEITNECIVIDPHEDIKSISGYISDNKLKPIAVLLTHGHFDHIGGVAYLKTLGAKVYMHKADVFKIDEDDQMARYLGVKIEHFDVDELVKDGDLLEICGFKIKVIETPGHTMGGVCYVLDEYIFTGDTIFRESYGRTDFEDSDFQMIKSSILKILSLEGEYTLLPGHGEETYLSFEKMYNPIMQD